MVSNHQHSRRSIVKKIGTLGAGTIGVVAGSSSAAADHCDGSLPCHSEESWSIGDETSTFAGTYTQIASQGTTIAYYGTTDAHNPNWFRPMIQVTTAAELEASDGGHPGNIINQYAWMSGESGNVEFNWNPRPGITLHTYPNGSGSENEEALVWTAIESAIAAAPGAGLAMTAYDLVNSYSPNSGWSTPQLNRSEFQADHGYTSEASHTMWFMPAVRKDAGWTQLTLATGITTDQGSSNSPEVRRDIWVSPDGAYIST